MAPAMAMGRWVLATSNYGKLEELRALLTGSGLEIVTQRELGVSSPAETGTTFVENAVLKARHAAAQTGLPAIADDSGLIVDALDGAPGVLSARYAGPGASDADNVAKLLNVLGTTPYRVAHFHCVIVALRSADDPAPAIAQGSWSGTITHTPRGLGGFGYDPVFLDPLLGATAAELEPAVKNRVSHRGQALAALATLLGLAASDRRTP
jgi:XTP/dITP diphosphohydrolase